MAEKVTSLFGGHTERTIRNTRCRSGDAVPIRHSANRTVSSRKLVVGRNHKISNLAQYVRSCAMREGIIIEVNAADRERLAAVVADRNSPQKHVWRARIILATAEGYGTAAIMQRAGVSKPCVWRWQERGSCARALLVCCVRRPESLACRHCRRRWSAGSSN